jgi:hypothetical protein
MFYMSKTSDHPSVSLYEFITMNITFDDIKNTIQ